MAKGKQNQKQSSTESSENLEPLPKIKEGEADFGRFEISAPPSDPAPGAQASVDSHDDGLNMRSPKFWMAAGAIVLILVAILVTASYLIGNKKMPTSTPNQVKEKTASSAPVVPGASPYKLPAVSNQSDINLLKDYFKQASPNFKDDLMSLVPTVAVDYYKKYKDASGDAKLEAARAFYIYLNNPASVANNQYKSFIEDVKRDLEKSIGKSLF